VLGPTDFKPHIGKTFRFGVTDLVLGRVDVHSRPGALHAAFTMVFSGPPGAVLPEGSYDISLGGGVLTTLHVMPIHTAGPGRQDYQVVFN
jgi:hypothetical protein